MGIIKHCWGIKPSVSGAQNLRRNERLLSARPDDPDDQPKAALAWIAIISLGLQAGGPVWVAGSIVAGTTALSVIIHCVYAIAFSTKPMVRLCGKARRWIQGALGAFFALAGLKLLSSRT